MLLEMPQQHFIEIWKQLLSSKWEKESKEVLWKVLPKVCISLVLSNLIR